MNMKPQRKHLKKKIEPRRIIAICILVFSLATIIIGSIIVMAIKSTEQTYVTYDAEPMTLGVTILDSVSYSEYVAQETEPTEAVTENVTTVVTQSVETEKPTAKPTEKQTEVETAAPTELETEPSEYFMVEIQNPDHAYDPQPIHLNDYEYDLAARIVMREFGNGGYTACCLQAQALRDAVIYEGTSVESVYHDYQYDYCSLNYEPNKNCYNAIDYIFEQGGLAVQHRILFMYCPAYAASSWHESQNFIVEYGGVRFFDAWR